MKVAIAYNDDAHLKGHLNPIEIIGEREVIATAREVVDTLAADHDCKLVPVMESLADASSSLTRFAPDVVINLCEGAFGNTRFESNISLFFDMLGLPHTGCDAIASRICQDKALLKKLLVDGGIPTPEGFAADGRMSDAEFLETYKRKLGLSQAIVKPSREDAGLGIERGSVVASAFAALARARAVEQRFQQAALVEQFVTGGELNQSIYWNAEGPVLLPPGEVIFGDDLPPEARIVGWEAKWDDGSPADLATRNRTPAEISSAACDRLQSICRHTAFMLGLSSYCRFDVREGAGGAMFVIDVNPNPDVGEGSGFRKALAAARIEFRDFLNELMIAAVSRAHRPDSHQPLPVG
jgi:D-alanine-D-alanine ligase